MLSGPRTDRTRARASNHRSREPHLIHLATIQSPLGGFQSGFKRDFEN